MSAHYDRLLKAEARERVAQFGHILGRFSREGADYEGGSYWLARCKGCLGAVVASEERYGARGWGSKTLLSARCPTPYVGEDEDRGCDGIDDGETPSGTPADGGSTPPTSTPSDVCDQRGAHYLADERQARTLVGRLAPDEVALHEDGRVCIALRDGGHAPIFVAREKWRAA